MAEVAPTLLAQGTTRGAHGRIGDEIASTRNSKDMGMVRMKIAAISVTKVMKKQNSAGKR